MVKVLHMCGRSMLYRTHKNISDAELREPTLWHRAMPRAGASARAQEKVALQFEVMPEVKRSKRSNARKREERLRMPRFKEADAARKRGKLGAKARAQEKVALQSEAEAQRKLQSEAEAEAQRKRGEDKWASLVEAQTPDGDGDDIMWTSAIEPRRLRGSTKAFHMTTRFLWGSRRRRRVGDDMM